MKILLLADEESKYLWDYFEKEKLDGIDLIISCGDLKAGSICRFWRHLRRFRFFMYTAIMMCITTERRPMAASVLTMPCLCIRDFGSQDLEVR